MRFITLSLLSAAFLTSLFYQGLTLNYLSGTLLLLFAALMLASFSRDTYYTIKPSTLSMLSLAFFIWLGLTTLWATVPHISAITLWKFCTALIIYMIFALTKSHERPWLKVTIMIFIIAVFFSHWAIYQYYFLDGNPTASFLNRNLLASILNIIVLMGITRWLLPDNTHNKRINILHLLAIASILYAIGLIGSRGALISYGIGLATLCLCAYKLRFRLKRIVLILGLSIVTLFVSINSSTFVTKIIYAASAPEEALSPRLLIWKASWALLKDSPWYGLGLGSFQYAYPPYRLPGDDNDGFFAHNDYLQITIEAGWPALLLLIAVMLYIFYLFIKTIYSKRPSAHHKMEIAGIFSALLAVSAHSVFTFNFYTPSTLILIGLLLHRFNAVTLAGGITRPWATLSIKTKYIKIVASLSFIVAALYFSALLIANDYFFKAQRHAHSMQYSEAENYYDKAARLNPQSDLIWTSRANMFRDALKSLEKTQDQQYQALFARANEYLDRAESLNPLKGQAPIIRGMLYNENPSLTNESSDVVALNEFIKAIHLNPRFFTARIEAARLLQSQGELIEAKRILEEGLDQYYPRYAKIELYYKYTAELRRLTGDEEGYQELMDKLETLSPINSKTSD